MADKTENIQITISDDAKMEEILDVCSRYAALDFSARVEPDYSTDSDLNALAVGLSTLGDELQDLVQRENKTKAQLNESAKEQSLINKELEQFIYISSHDLQEPLRTITSFVGLIDESHRDELPAQIIPYFDFIQKSVNRMSDQIFDLLNYLRVLKGEQKIRVNLNEVLKHALSKKSDQLKECNAQVKYTHLPTILAFDDQMDVLFENLISNAIKFCEPSRDLRIEIAAKDTEFGIAISFIDNGIGIDEKYFGKIFQIFQRLHNKKDIPGTGMGLALCEKIALNHNGNIAVESEPDHGASFTVFLNDELSSPLDQT